MIKRLGVILILAILAADAFAVRFLTQPYLQNMSATGVTIMWLADDNTGMTGWVELRRKGQAYQKYVAADRGLIVAYDKINKVRIDGLEPGTEYAYRVADVAIGDITNTGLTYGDTIYSDVYKFITPQENGEHVSCKIFNDVHDYHNLYEQMLQYDIQSDYDFVFFNGDILNATATETNVLTNFIKPCVKMFASEKPLVTVRGNHEVRREWARRYFDYFDMGNDNKGYFSFRWGPVFFIALDSGEDTEDADPQNLFAFDSYREEQVEWLRAELNSDQRRNAAYTVVFMHIPTWPNTSKERHAMLHCRQLFQPLFHEYGIDALISGHTHKPGIYPADSSHQYPIVIGGGYDTSSGSEYHPTMITLDANPYSMEIKIYNYSGKQIHSIVIENKDNLPALSGEMMLLRLGDGTKAMNTQEAYPMFLDEYRLEGRSAIHVGTIALPTETTAGNYRCLGVGSALTSSFLSRTADGCYLLVTGYDASAGEKPVSKSASEVRRVVALIDADGNVNTTTGLTGVFNKSDIRDAASKDGYEIYVSGGGGETGNGGVWLTTRGSNNATCVSSPVFDTRNVKFYDGELYISTSGSLLSSQFTEFLPSDFSISDALDFCMVKGDNEGEDVLYWITGTNAISKYSRVKGGWNYNGTYENVIRPHAIEAKRADGCVQLYVVASANISSGASKLVLLEETGGYNAPMRCLQTDLVDMTGTKTSLRGFAWKPVISTGLQPVAVENKLSVAEKYMIDGKVYIRRQNKIYTLLGQIVKQ